MSQERKDPNFYELPWEGAVHSTLVLKAKHKWGFEFSAATN